jgi:hypothetical protein
MQKEKIVILRVGNAQKYQIGKEKQELQEGRVKEGTTRILKGSIQTGKGKTIITRGESQAVRPVRQAE